MYIITTEDLIDAEEPQLGTISDTELFEGYDGEARTIAFKQMEDEQELQGTYAFIDDNTDQDSEFLVTDYFDNKEIDILNALFMEDNEWTERQLEYILDNLVFKCVGGLDAKPETTKSEV